MERLSFASAAARPPSDPRLEHVTVAPLARGPSIQAAVFRLGPGGCIRRHPAAAAQLLAVTEGSGWVSAADGNEEPITRGEAVFWEEGEEHETRTESGLTALVIEGSGLVPFQPS
jgi:quercetin dioxygenase-like cupin family protein